MISKDNKYIFGFILILIGILFCLRFDYFLTITKGKVVNAEVVDLPPFCRNHFTKIVVKVENKKYKYGISSLDCRNNTYKIGDSISILYYNGVVTNANRNIWSEVFVVLYPLLFLFAIRRKT